MRVDDPRRIPKRDLRTPWAYTPPDVLGRADVLPKARSRDATAGDVLIAVCGALLGVLLGVLPLLL